MIDWLTMNLPIAHRPIPAGRVVKISPDGEIEWESPAHFQLIGSFDSSVRIRSRGEINPATGFCSALEISGNPVKFLTGHNIFGSDALLPLVKKFIRRVLTLSGVDYSHVDFRRCIATGDFTISRIDITFSFDLASRSEVQAWIRAADHKCRTRRGKGVLKGLSTLVFGGTSKRPRWMIVIYCKGDEVAVHPLHDDIPSRDQLYKYADTLLRCELRLRSMELNDLNLRNGADWVKTSAYEIWLQYMRRIDMNAQLTLPDEVSLNLNPTLAATYHRWKDGADLRQFYSHSKFYNHRNKLKSYGIDISMPPSDLEVKNFTSNVVPLIRYLEAKPAKVPSWAREAGLYV